MEQTLQQQSSFLVVSRIVANFERHSALSSNIPVGVVWIIAGFHPIYALYSIGDNSSNQLGLSIQPPNQGALDINPNPKWRYLPTMSALCLHPDFVRSGDGNFFMKSMDDQIYSAGFNSHGSCGVGSNEGKIQRFTAIPFPESAAKHRIDVMSNGVYTDHSFVVMVNEESGIQRIFGFGSNLSQQQGFRSIQEEKHVDSPQPIDSLNSLFIGGGHRIVQITTGLEHSLFLTESGRVFSCGDNFHGQCGVISQQKEPVNGGNNPEEDSFGKWTEQPRLIPLLHDIEEIASGAFHNLCIDRRHNLYAFGCNESGELGLGADTTSPKICAAVMSSYFDREGDDFEIVAVKCGDMHSMVFSVNGKVYLFGSNSSGQIGNGTKGEGVTVPYCIQNGDAFKEMEFVTGDAGCNHSLLVSRVPRNELYAFGGNHCGQIGFASDLQLKQTTPRLVERGDIGIADGPQIAKVIADDELTLVICSI